MSKKKTHAVYSPDDEHKPRKTMCGQNVSPVMQTANILDSLKIALVSCRNCNHAINGGSGILAGYHYVAKLALLAVLLFCSACSNKKRDQPPRVVEDPITATGGGPVNPPAPVPEPHTMVLFGLGLAAVVARRRRRQESNRG